MFECLAASKKFGTEHKAQGIGERLKGFGFVPCVLRSVFCTL
jgi:hypothetical protein